MLDSPIPVQLSLTPELLRALVTGLTPDDLAWQPAPGRFSICEALAHLAHAEKFAYQVKYELFASEDDPILEPYDVDGLVEANAYSGRDAEESLTAFTRQRHDNLGLLRSLPGTHFTKTGQHRKAGVITLADLVNECAYHDLGHVRQVAELIRARRYHPNMGAYARFYQPHP